MQHAIRSNYIFVRYPPPYERTKRLCEVTDDDLDEVMSQAVDKHGREEAFSDDVLDALVNVFCLIYDSTPTVTPPSPRAYPWGFVMFSLRDGLFPTPGQAERGNSPSPGLAIIKIINTLFLYKMEKTVLIFVQ